MVLLLLLKMAQDGAVAAEERKLQIINWNKVLNEHAPFNKLEV